MASAGAPSSASPVGASGRSRSGRVTMRPLAFWANEVVAREVDGGFKTEGEAVRLEALSVTDFTATFRTERLPVRGVSR